MVRKPFFPRDNPPLLKSVNETREIRDKHVVTRVRTFDVNWPRARAEVDDKNPKHIVKKPIKRPFIIRMRFLALLFLSVQSAVDSDGYDKRRLDNISCNLAVQDCSFMSGSQSDGNRIRLAFGSTCVLNLTKCRVGSCYSIIDWSFDLRWAHAPGIRRSAFHSINISGVRAYNISMAGMFFQPSNSAVTIAFSVQTCDNFYRLHPFVPKEDCETGGPEISPIMRGLPICSDDLMTVT
jgi:hypothetical protein